MAFLGWPEESNSLFPRVRLLNLIMDDVCVCVCGYVGEGGGGGDGGILWL